MDAEQHDPRRTGRTDARQLRLLNTSDHPEWQLDEATRAVGRRGVAQARAALRAARIDHDADLVNAPGPAATAPSQRSDAA